MGVTLADSLERNFSLVKRSRFPTFEINGNVLSGRLLNIIQSLCNHEAGIPIIELTNRNGGTDYLTAIINRFGYTASI